jgi:hypothetical protein
MNEKVMVSPEIQSEAVVLPDRQHQAGKSAYGLA